MRRTRLAAVGASCALLLPLWGAAVPARAAQAMSPTKGGRLVVIVQNLREWFNGPDDVYGNATAAGCTDLAPECHKELSNFAKRIATHLTKAPDVILIQEANHNAVKLTAEKLTKYVGSPYAAAVLPPVHNPHTGHGDGTWVREKINGHWYTIKTNTAVIYNAATMSVADKGGYIRTLQDPSDFTGAYGLVGNREAFTLLREKRTGAYVAAAAIHFATYKRFTNTKDGIARKEQWSRSIANQLFTRYPNADWHMMGGEFNNKRCRHQIIETVTCMDPAQNGKGPMPFWKTLTAPFNIADSPHTFGLKDTVFVRHNNSDADLGEQQESRGGNHKRIDYIFSSRHIYHSTRDLTYSVPRLTRHYISDHRWVMADVGLPASHTTLVRPAKAVTGSGRHVVRINGTFRPRTARGAQMKLRLYKSKHHRWILRTVRAVGVEQGSFGAKLPAPRHTDRCKVIADFKGNRHLAESEDVRKFAC